MTKSEEEKAGDEVTAFAEAYFNYNLKKAQKYVTTESLPWLQFLASNLTQTDLDSLNHDETPATVTLQSFNLEGDSMGRAIIVVSHFMLLDSIDGGQHMVDEAEYTLPVVKRQGHWLVKLSSLLGS